MVHAVQPRLDALTAPVEICLGELPSSNSFSTVLRFARANYDWVVADLGQGLSPLSMALIPELDTLYIVTTPRSRLCTRRAGRFRKLVSSQLTAERPRLVVNRVRAEHAPDSKDMERLFSLPVEALPARGLRRGRRGSLRGPAGFPQLGPGPAADAARLQGLRPARPGAARVQASRFSASFEPARGAVAVP